MMRESRLGRLQGNFCSRVLFIDKSSRVECIVSLVKCLEYIVLVLCNVISSDQPCGGK